MWPMQAKAQQQRLSSVPTVWNRQWPMRMTTQMVSPMLSATSVANMANASSSPAAMAMICTPSVAPAVANAHENPMVSPAAATTMISAPSVAHAVANAHENPMVSPAAAAMISSPSVAINVANASPAAAAMISAPGVANVAYASNSPEANGYYYPECGTGSGRCK